MSAGARDAEPASDLTVALVADVFPLDDGAEVVRRRLGRRLAEAADAGAELAVLPELPLNSWAPATKRARDADAEPPCGPRHELLAEAARTAGLALVGGAIVQRPEDGRRHGTALVFDARGELLASYAKLAVPREPGFWELHHYEPGDDPPQVIDELALPFGVQICSDVNRPEGCHVLGAAGAAAVLAPRATERATWARWRTVFIANALTSCLYVLSVNRPGAEQGVLIGGPSICVAPDGEVLAESLQAVTTVTLQGERVAAAARAYPGYLPVRAGLYARAWKAVAERSARRLS